MDRLSVNTGNHTGVGFGRRSFYGVRVRGRAANASSFNRFGFVSPSDAKLMIRSASAFLVASWSKVPPLFVRTSQASLNAASRIASVAGSKLRGNYRKGY